MSWYLHWDSSFDLAKGGIELSFRRYEDMIHLLVETEAIRVVNRIIDKIATPYISTRYHIIGARGFGKSTILNYVAFSLFSNLDSQKAIPVYGSLLGTAADEKELEFIFFRSLLESLFDISSDLPKFQPKEMFAKSLEQLTKAREEYKKKLKQLGQVSLEFIYTAFENQLDHLRETFIKIVFLLDGLDKQDTNAVLKFLRNTQERLNSLVNKYNCMFLDAADPSWRETLDTKEFSGVRGIPISLRVWTAEEIEALIKKRLEGIGIYQMPFDRRALEILVEDFQGNPREILQYATTLMHFAAKERVATIGPGLAREIVWTNDSKEKFFNFIIREMDARYAFEKLKTIYTERQMMNILIAAYTHRGQRLSKTLNYEARSSVGVTVTDGDYQKFLSILLTKGCFKMSKIQNYVELEDDVRKLFDFVAEMGQSLVALPVVLSELEFKVESVAPPPQEEIMIKDEIQKVFEQHPSEWLTYKKTKELLFDNPRTKKKLEERFKVDYDKKITATIPLVIYKLLEEGRLMHDEATSSYRWRPSWIDFTTADWFRSKEILDLIDATKQALSSENMKELGRCCEETFLASFSKINAFCGSRFETTKIQDKVDLLKSLDINISTPVPLNVFLSSIEKTTPNIYEARVWLQTAILYAKRIFSKVNQLSRYEPKNQEIADKLEKCKTGIFKEEERQYFRTFLLPMLLENYGKLVECMTLIKIKTGIIEEVPVKLASLIDNGQMLPAELYECPVCKKPTIVSAKEIEVMNCLEDKVPLTRIKSGYMLSKEAYEAWNVWMEEYTRAILEQLPCKYIETGIALKPTEAVGIATPEEVDSVVVFNGKSIAVECMENVEFSQKKNDVIDVIRKAENLGLFDSIILVYRHTNDQKAFTAMTKKHQKFLFPIMVKRPRIFKRDLHITLKSIEKAHS